MAHKRQPSKTGLSGLRRKLGILVFADWPERGEIAAALAGSAEPPLELREENNNGATAAESGAADVIMFVFDSAHQPEVVPITAATPGADRPARIALIRQRSAHAIREALRAGADDVLFLPLDQEDLTRALLKVSETRLFKRPPPEAN